MLHKKCWWMVTTKIRYAIEKHWLRFILTGDKIWAHLSKKKKNTTFMKKIIL